MKTHLVRAGILVLVLVPVAACDRFGTEVHFDDLVTARRLVVDGEPSRPQETVAEDETWVSVTLEAGALVTVEVELSASPTLTLAGCLECSDDAGPAATGALIGDLRSEDGDATDFEVGFGVDDGWWRRTVDLEAWAGRRAELALRADLADGCVLRLREATVRDEHRVAVARSEKRTQILLISVDTLRRDGVGVFNPRVATPHLDRLADESETWTRAYAAASWTKPSHASLLTGFHPDTHRAILFNQGMDAGVPTMAERLRAGGFATAALVFDCTWLSPRWGFGKGFDSYRVTPWRAGRQARAAAGWLVDHRDRDFFFFLHTFEPHSDFSLLPYEAPGVNRRTIAEEFGIDGYGCRRKVCGSRFLKALNRKDIPERGKDRKILRHTYDAGVGYLDESLGVLFDALRQSGLWDDLTVVVTSDHGEEFSEHGGYGHQTLHDEVLRVPLFIKWPGGKRAGRRNSVPSSGVDIAPTLIQHAGLDAPELPGENLRSRRADTPIFAGTLERAVIARGLKAIFKDGQAPKLFDLENDPREKIDLAARRPEDVARLRTLLEDQRRRALALHRRIGTRDASQVVLGERDRERLEAFGYLQ